MESESQGIVGDRFEMSIVSERKDAGFIISEADSMAGDLSIMVVALGRAIDGTFMVYAGTLKGCGGEGGAWLAE